MFFAKRNDNVEMTTKLTLLPLHSANNLCCEYDLRRYPLGA